MYCNILVTKPFDQYFTYKFNINQKIKKGSIVDKGIINNHVSCRIFEYLTDKGVPTHFVKSLNDREMLVKNLKIVPVEVVLRNVVAGSLSKRMGIKEGEPLKRKLLALRRANS